jgi:lipoprotein Spr
MDNPDDQDKQLTSKSQSVKIPFSGFYSNFMLKLLCPFWSPVNFCCMLNLRSPLIFSALTLLFACSPGRKSTQPVNNEVIVTSLPPDPLPPSGAPVVVYDNLQVKYARYLNVPPDQIRNLALYRFIDRWLNTPYKWGGTDAHGIDCSAFLQRLLSEVYEIEIPRTSVQQFFDEWIDRFGSTKYLAEGDLVFFQTLGEDKLITHVGFYLDNRMFVNSSSSKGVSIACLDDPYWKKHFVAAGRIKIHNQATR